MKETGIIMSGDHPKLILDGIKVMTRRVMKPQLPDGYTPCTCSRGTKHLYKSKGHKPGDVIVIKCPYGQVGDRLWVRETLVKRDDGYAIYAVGSEQVLIGGAGISEGVSWEWKKDTLNGMFMPRWASRITLEITEVRVERVQEISPEDCLSEGIPPIMPHQILCSMDKATWYQRRFRDLWDSLNAKRGYGWAVNPWVWCISFKIVDILGGKEQ